MSLNEAVQASEHGGGRKVSGIAHLSMQPVNVRWDGMCGFAYNLSIFREEAASTFGTGSAPRLA